MSRADTFADCAWWFYMGAVTAISAILFIGLVYVVWIIIRDILSAP